MRSTLIAVLWLTPSMALAQAAAPSDPFGPADPQVKGPPATYRSVFGRPPTTTEESPWRAANDEAGRLGGHVGQLRESERPPAPAGQDTNGAANAASSQRMHTHDRK